MTTMIASKGKAMDNLSENGSEEEVVSIPIMVLSRSYDTLCMSKVIFLLLLFSVFSSLIAFLFLNLGTWVSKGCYVNMSPERALGKSIDNNVENTQGNNNIFYYCVKKAEIFGYKIFGADNKNCWVGDDAETTYDKFGGSSKCSISKSGYGSGTALYADMFVYRYEE